MKIHLARWVCQDVETNLRRVKEEIWDLDWVKRFLKNVNENYGQYRSWR